MEADEVYVTAGEKERENEGIAAGDTNMADQATRPVWDCRGGCCDNNGNICLTNIEKVEMQIVG